jgi:NADH dehydrogenase
MGRQMIAPRVTVFGGSGFLGRYLVRRLAADGSVVRVATRDPVRAAFVKTAGDVGQIVPMRCNVCDDDTVAAAVAGADVVINLVGILYEWGRQRFSAVQAEAPGRIAHACAAAGVSRLVHMSALGADSGSASEYARTKAAGEAAARAGYPGVTIFRPSILIGPEDGFFNRFAQIAMLSPVLPLIGGGRTRFQPAYVGDAADAIMAALAEPATAGQLYELGGPRAYTFRELMEIMLKTINRRRCLVSVPFGLAEFQAMFLQLLPVPLLTRDQVRLLESDNVVSGAAPGLRELGIQPQPIEAILPTYLDIYRRGGRFAASRAA